MTQELHFPRESASSLLVEMWFNPAGRVFESVDELQLQAHGSAFLYSLDGGLYLVTARHNLTGRHPDTGRSLGERNVSPTHLRLTMLAGASTPDGGWAVTVIPGNPGEPASASGVIPMEELALPLISNDLKPIWREHPQYGGAMDVAVLSLPPFRPDILVVPWVGSDQQDADGMWSPLMPGQDVMVLGYPDKLASGPRFPLWIRGSIASHPQMGYVLNERSLPMFLIDARTRRGQSGSAVIRHRPARSVFVDAEGTLRRSLAPSSQLLGVYSGRTSDQSDLGFVWMREHIDVICRTGVPGTGVF